MERVAGSHRAVAVRALALWGLAVPALVAVVWLVCGGATGSGTDGNAPLAMPTTTPDRLLTGVPDPTGKRQTGSRAAVGTTARPALELGFGGYAAAQSMPRHRVVLSLRSTHRLPFVVYNVPTSRDHRSGELKDLGSTWSIATTAYGDPDYAQMYTWAGPEGYPITCTITVDGRVTARHTTTGAWGTLYCQG
jgi:hypothetical protein